MKTSKHDYISNLKELLLFLSLALLFIPAEFPAQSTLGGEIFQQKCTACHTVGDGKRIGPDLANVHKKRSEEWLINFIQSSQSLINSGDSAANAVYEEYNKVLMPDQPLSKNEVLAVIDFISTNSPDPGSPDTRTPIQIFNPATVTDADIEKGKQIFEGNAKLENGGASCISCHNVSAPGLIRGGLLAKDLTQSFSRMGAAGVDAILRNPPFPAMVNTYSEHPLTDQEIKDILAFLYKTDQAGVYQNASLNDLVYIVVTILGINFIFLLILLNWRRVKKNSANSFLNK